MQADCGPALVLSPLVDSTHCLLLRHPPVSAWAGRCYGQTDVPVDSAELATAVAQVNAGLRCAGRRFAVYTSPLERCRALAESLHLGAPDIFAPPVTDGRLKEMDFARWEGLAWDGIARSEIDAWAADPWDYQPGGGESARQMLQRWRSVKADLAGGLGSLRQSGGVAHRSINQSEAGSADVAGSGAYGTPLLVTHAGIIRLALFDAGLLLEEDLWLYKVPHAQPIAVRIQSV